MDFTEQEQRKLEQTIDLENTKRIIRNACTRFFWNSQSKTIENLQDLLPKINQIPELKELWLWGAEFGFLTVMALGVAAPVCDPDPELDDILRPFYEQMRESIDPENLKACSVFLFAVDRVYGASAGMGSGVIPIVLNRAAHGMEWQSNVKTHRPDLRSMIESSEDPSSTSYEDHSIVALPELLVVGLLASLGCLFMVIGQ